MPRDIPVGNGSMLVAFDETYRIRDIYFPHVGRENHSEGHPFRFGVWADGYLSWAGDSDWSHSLDYLPETLVTEVRLTNKRLELEIVSNDAVDVHENIFVRRVRVRNLRTAAREVRLFFHQDFYISETKIGDTAYFDPETSALIHYKGQRYFLISTDAPEGVETFATGRKAFQGAEGTWRDAEDGQLSESAIMEGSVDSTIGRTLRLEADGTTEMFYWIAAGTSHGGVAELNRIIREQSPGALLQRTENYWRAWVNKNDTQFDDLPAEIVRLYKRSLLIIRTQIDNGGAILAANDSDVTLRATDHYSYMWPRDGALVAHALDRARYSSLTRSFFSFCASIITREGYFLQKYNPDGSLASGWHAAWDAQTRTRLLPIQEDETALVLWALWHHYDEFRDIEFIGELYRPLIVRAADFLTHFRDERTALPLPSWNLWENRRGVHTFTSASVVGGLLAAARFAALFGENELSSRYDEAAAETRAAMEKYLWLDESGRFARSIMPKDNGEFEVDATLDSSLCGLFLFGAFDVGDHRVQQTVRAVEERLWVDKTIGGLARFEEDDYMRPPDAGSKVPGNPWFVCTLWLAEYKIAEAKTIGDLQAALDLLVWTARRAFPSGVLAEQLHPATGAPLSVSPLTWSHASFVSAVVAYLRKRQMFESDKNC